MSRPRYIRSRVVLLVLALVAALAAGSPAPAAAATKQLLVNPTFDSTAKPWWASGGMQPDVSSGELCVTATKSSNLWDLLVGQNGLYLAGQGSFRLEFDVRAAAAVTLGTQVSPVQNPTNIAYLGKTFAAGPAAQHHSFDFATTYDDPYVLSQVTFRLGGLSAPTQVCFDNVTLTGTAYVYQPDTGSAVKVNQVGYLTRGPKNATVVTDERRAQRWELFDGTRRIDAGFTEPAGLDPSAGVRVHTIDFSDVRRPGEAYHLVVGDQTSPTFRIADDTYAALRTDALRFFYTNRSGTPIDGTVAGQEYARAAGHLGIAPNQGDTSVGCQQPKPWMDNWTCDYTLDVTGGWYDAGDHGKYVVNGGIAVSQLMSAWERAVQAGTQRALGDSTLAVPERGNKIPDILDEAKWELDFLLKMQVPAGRPLAGMAHHKVQDDAWTGLPLAPAADPKPRQLHRPSTAATLNLAAVAAQGARVFARFDPAYAATLRAAAERAYAAAEANPALFAPDADGDSGGGAYADDDVSDEFYWAAAELYLTTGARTYRRDVERSPQHRADVFSEGFYWGSVAALGRMDLARFGHRLPDHRRIVRSVEEGADTFLRQQRREPFGQPYAPEDGKYAWGSSSSVLNNQVVLATAYDLTGERRYARAVLEGYDYLMGRNVLSQSYITGWGEKFSENQHSRMYAHQLDPKSPHPPVGTISGGPNSSLQDPVAKEWLAGCAPQACYVDNIEAWSVNEITVNWNSALTWVASFVADLGDGRVR